MKLQLLKKDFKLFLSVFFIVLGMSVVNGQTISTPVVTGAPVCQGATVTITFTATSANGTPRQFTNATVFQPYLSAVGGGATYTALPTFTVASLPATGTNGASYPGLTAVITIPIATTPGTLYKISLGCSGDPTINGSTGANASASFTVSAAPVGGTVTGGTTICSGGTSGLLTLSGHTGTILRWESSVSPFSSWSTIANTTTTYTSAALTQTTQFRAVVQSGSCQATSTPTTVTVNPLPTGTLTNSGAVCTGTQPQLIYTATTGTGPYTLVINGQTYTGRTSGVAFTATGTAPITNTTYTLTSVTGVNCSNPSPTASTAVTVNPTSVGGSVTGGTTICSGSTSGLLTLAGNTGTVVRWESSVSPFSTWTTIANTNTTYTSGALTQTTQFRAVVQSGVCATANSAATTLTVNPTTVGGSVTGGTAICSGSTSGLLTLAGNTGTVVRWESSVSPFSTWTTIATTNATYTSGVLTQTTQFRAVVQSGVCATVNSAATTVTIGSTTWDGTSWSNGAPTSATTAVMTGNYTSSSSISACSLTVTNSSTVLITSGDSVTLNGALTVDAGSSFTLENNANLLQNGSSNLNSGSITVKRNSSALKRQDYTLWSSPVAGQQLQSFSPGTLSNRFYTYDTSANQYAVVAAPAATNFSTATGCLIRMPNTHPATATVWAGSFAGVPNSGDYGFTMTDGGSGLRFNLVGNPYPSPIDATDFVGNTTNAANTTGALYFWRKTNNSASPTYCTWTTGGFVSNGEAQVFDPNDVIQTGQGFFVEASGNGTALEFNNSMRVDDHANQFFRAATTVERNRIWLNATGADGLFSQAMVGYMSDATNGVDAAVDGKYINDGAIALTSLIETTPYAIQGRSLPFDAADVVPMQFKATTAGTYAIALDHVDGLFSGAQDIFLRDAQTGIDHDIKSGAYSFTTEAGTFANRFSVVYSAALSVDNPTLNANSIVIYKNENQSFTVNSGAVTMESIKVFDVRGRLLTTQDNINATQTSITAGQVNQVLLVQITSIDGASVTKKVVR